MHKPQASQVAIRDKSLNRLKMIPHYLSQALQLQVRMIKVKWIEQMLMLEGME